VQFRNEGACPHKHPCPQVSASERSGYGTERVRSGISGELEEIAPAAHRLSSCTRLDLDSRSLRHPIFDEKVSAIAMAGTRAAAHYRSRYWQQCFRLWVRSRVDWVLFSAHLGPCTGFDIRARPTS